MPRIWHILMFCAVMGSHNSRIVQATQEIYVTSDTNNGIEQNEGLRFDREDIMNSMGRNNKDNDEHDDHKHRQEHRQLGFFVNRGSRRRSRGRGSGGRPTLPRIDRDRDPLAEGMWKRKRVDMIRPSSLATPTVAPPSTAPTTADTANVTMAPTAANSTPPPPPGVVTNATIVPVPGGTGVTSAPTTAAGAGAGTTAAPTVAGATVAPTAAGTTAAPTAAATPATTAAGGLPMGGMTGGGLAGLAGDLTMVPAGVPRTVESTGSSLDYQVASTRTSVVCTGGAQDFSFGVDIQVNFLNNRFRACTGRQFYGLTTMLETTLNMAFPAQVPTWPGKVEFKSVQFDVDQFALHINPYANNDPGRRHLLRKEANATSKFNYSSALIDDVYGGEQQQERQRQLQEITTTTCPERPSICKDTTDVCIYGCGIATVSDCGDDMTLWESLGSSLSTAISALGLECLGGSEAPVVELTVLPL